jgi:hypothetical protein
VLRKVINGTWGTEISSSAANDTLSLEFYLNLDTEWNSSNCEVISFIYNAATSEVIQAGEAKIKN